MDLQTLFASTAAPLLSLKEPFMYQYSPELPGTILQQSPEPGTSISGPTALELVVSRGMENEMIKVPALTGLSISAALAIIGDAGVRFTFSQRAPGRGENPETVLSQTPAAETLAAANTEISLVVSSPVELKAGEVFGLFSYTLPINPYPLPVSLEAQLPTGTRQSIVTMNHPGGKFTVPYRLPAGSTLILSMLGREIYREEVSLPRGLDQL
jgi:beta-lactam-binding protein with PASTA domain